MISKILRNPDSTTASGMSRWISTNNYDGINEKVVTNRFEQKHHMYKTYGITAMEIRKYNDGRECINIDGDIFEGSKKKNFSYFVSNCSTERCQPLNKNIEIFLKDIKKVRKMNITDDMIRVIKCIH